jgi:hypothetical protein
MVDPDGQYPCLFGLEASYLRLQQVVVRLEVMAEEHLRVWMLHRELTIISLTMVKKEQCHKVLFIPISL